jgi:Flp pilus assembly protein TadG
VVDARRLRGQALVEFAIAVPILVLIVAGVLELGRGYSYAVATSNAARDGARYVAGKTATSNGPGVPAMCNLVKADVAAITGNFSCATVVGVPPPFRVGVDFPRPTAGQVVVAVYCGTTVDCRGSTNLQYRTEVDVGVFFGFNDLNILGGPITISGTSRETTSW